MRNLSNGHASLSFFSFDVLVVSRTAETFFLRDAKKLQKIIVEIFKRIGKVSKILFCFCYLLFSLFGRINSLRLSFVFVFPVRNLIPLLGIN